MTGLSVHDHDGVALAYWVPAGQAKGTDEPVVQNLGDYLGQAIAAKLATPGSGNGARLLTAGSILHLSERGDVVWGSGLNAKLSRAIGPATLDADYRAVRGPLTRNALLLGGAHVPAVVGDPVLLLPEAFPEVRQWTENKRRSIAIVPNLNDLDAFHGQPDVVSPLGDPWEAVRAIAESEFVVGSSLHAIIVAEALGIPARFVLSSRENPWKYHDYLLSTGRRKERFAESVDEARSLGAHPAIDIDLDALRSAFPHDLWAEERDHSRSDQREAPDPATIVDDVVALLCGEFDDVREPGRGGIPMVRSIVRLLGAPLVRSYGHRLSAHRLAPVSTALQLAIADDADDLEIGSGPVREIVTRLVDGNHATLHRIALRDALGPSTRIESIERTAQRFVWMFTGLGLGPPELRRATDARVVLKHRRGEVVLGTGRLDVVIDEPDFRWSVRIDARDLPAGARRFDLRIDWCIDGAWVSGGAITRHPKLVTPQHLEPVDKHGWILGEMAARYRNREIGSSPALPTHRGAIRSDQPPTWLFGPARPELSVIVTAHNVGNWLDETLHTILNQGVPGTEVILVDDHSTDATERVLERHSVDPRITVVHSVDRGGANARDVGVAASRGRFLIFADGDDLVPNGAYAELIDRLRASGSDLAVGDFIKFSPEEIWRPTANWKVFGKERTAVSLENHPGLLRGRAVWNKAFRRDFWDRQDITFPEVPRSNDIVPMTRAYLSARSIDIVQRDVYLYRDRPGSTSMTSKSRSTVGLLSYLRQEVECVRLVSQTESRRLLATMAGLIIVSDGWRHIQKAAASADGLDPRIVPLVAELLDALPPELILARGVERHAVVRLIAIGRCDAASDIVRFTDSPANAKEAALALDGWLDAVEHLPQLTDDDQTAHDCFMRRVRPALRKLAQYGPDGATSSVRWLRALRLAHYDAGALVEAGVLEFAAGAASDADFSAANRLIARNPSGTDGAATIDDWILVLGRAESQPMELVRRIWVREIMPRVHERLQADRELSPDQWDRLSTALANSVEAHPHPKIQRAGPAVVARDQFGPEVATAAVRLAADGIPVDTLRVRAFRASVGGNVPEGFDATRLSLRFESTQGAVDAPVKISTVRGQQRWSATVDLRRVPLDGSSTADVVMLAGSLAWHKVPMIATDGAPAGRRSGPIELVKDTSFDGAVQLSLAGVVGLRSGVRSMLSLLPFARTAYRALGRVRRTVRLLRISEP